MQTRRFFFLHALFLAITLSWPNSPASAAEQPEEKAVKIPAGVQHDAWNALLRKYVDDRGLVNYAAWKGDARDRAALDTYLQQFVREGREANGDEKAASLANAYNAFVIQHILQHYPLESVWQTKQPFKARTHQVGGELVSLDDLEKGTLVPMIGWRTHAILVCAARSCPPLLNRAYTSAQFNEQVDDRYRAWLARTDLNEFQPAKKKVEISSIFKWYKADFEKAGGEKKILARYAPRPVQSFAATGDYQVGYKTYEWGLNDQGDHGRHYGRVQFLFDSLAK